MMVVPFKKLACIERLGSPIVRNPATGIVYDLSALHVITEGNTHGRLSCEFLCRDPRLPPASFAFPEQRIFIHIHTGSFEHGVEVYPENALEMA